MKNRDKIRRLAATLAALPWLISLIIVVGAGPQAAYAADPPATVQPFQTYSIEAPIEANVPQVIGRFINMIIGVTGSIALLMFAYGGFTWLTSRGNPEQIQKGKNVFIWATIGLIIIFSSYIILKNVFRVIGAE
jgi:hypothetical protein